MQNIACLCSWVHKTGSFFPQWKWVSQSIIDGNTFTFMQLQFAKWVFFCFSIRVKKSSQGNTKMHWIFHFSSGSFIYLHSTSIFLISCQIHLFLVCLSLLIDFCCHSYFSVKLMHLKFAKDFFTMIRLYQEKKKIFSMFPNKKLFFNKINGEKKYKIIILPIKIDNFLMFIIIFFTIDLISVGYISPHHRLCDPFYSFLITFLSVSYLWLITCFIILQQKISSFYLQSYNLFFLSQHDHEALEMAEAVA